MTSQRGRHDFHPRKWLQVRYLLLFLGVLGAGGGVLGAVLHRRLHADLRLAMSLGHSRLTSPWEAVKAHFITANLGATAVILLAALALTVALSLTIALGARTLTRNLRDYQLGVEPEHWRPIRHPRELRHLQRLLAIGLEDHRRHVARLRLRCEELKHALGEARELMLREKRAPDHRQMRALHHRFHELRAAYHFFKRS